MKKTGLFLSYLDNREKQNLTEALCFLCQSADNHKAEVSKRIFLAVAEEIYGKDKELRLLTDNGKCSGFCVRTIGGMHLYSVIQFKEKDLTPEALKEFGKTYNSHFPYHYAVFLDKGKRELYLCSIQDKFCPNWNEEYEVQRCIALKEVNFPILKEDSLIYRIDDALHGALNAFIFRDYPKFQESATNVAMVIKDQHGSYMLLDNETIDALFRDYADNYTGYRNYRRQTASEWEIVDDATKQRFEEWKKTAARLKSDFDKFYGGGIVD